MGLKKIHPEDHRFASPGLRSDDINSDHEGQIFLSHPHQIVDSFSCSPLNIPFLYFWKRIPDVLEYAEMGYIMLTLL